MARPVKPIDWDLVEEMALADCSGIAIAANFNIDNDTFYLRFKKEYGISYQDYKCSKALCGKALLQTAQFRKALNENEPGSTQLLIWLGKVLLGQKESDHVAVVDAQTQANVNALLTQLAEQQAQAKAMTNSAHSQALVELEQERAQARAKACTSNNTDCKS